MIFHKFLLYLQKLKPLYDGADIPRRTFNNWKDAIQQAFDINIECKRTGGYHYYIENPEDLENSTTRSWLLNTFTVKNIISESRSIKERILIENVPSGQKYLTPIIDAMQASKWMEINHGSYWYDRPCAYTVQPWCLKLFNQRWYVCGYCRERDAMRTFALDRIIELTTLDETFEYPDDFDPQGYFGRRMGNIRIPPPPHLGLHQHSPLPHGTDGDPVPGITPRGHPEPYQADGGTL